MISKAIEFKRIKLFLQMTFTFNSVFTATFQTSRISHFSIQLVNLAVFVSVMRSLEPWHDSPLVNNLQHTVMENKSHKHVPVHPVAGNMLT